MLADDRTLARMRLATWNINGLRARLDYLRLWLAARKPDVVGLQEIKITDEEFNAVLHRPGLSRRNVWSEGLERRCGAQPQSHTEEPGKRQQEHDGNEESVIGHE